MGILDDVHIREDYQSFLDHLVYDRHEALQLFFGRKTAFLAGWRPSSQSNNGQVSRATLQVRSKYISARASLFHSGTLCPQVRLCFIPMD